MKHVVFSAVVCGAFAAVGVTLPVCEVAERAQRESAVYPGRVVPALYAFFERMRPRA